MSSLSTLPGSSGKLLRRIHRACRPSLDEPNLALNLEICDLINEKQGSLPREAAIAIAKLINSRDSNVSELALGLLDNLVKNCGYPFHLQISRKEFLNELVKRFPFQPPPVYTRLQRSILLLLEEWTQTLCKTSRYKDDLSYIRDMHRLLKSKGYTFPKVKSEDFAVLTPNDNLKSLEEIQKEESIAQHAKLQELIRRGTPKDLQEANELMKIMSGFKEDEELINESRLKISKDLDKIKRKLDILYEIINNSLNTGIFDKNDDTIEDLYASLKSSQPNLQRIINEEQNNDNENSNGSFSIDELLKLNDSINLALEKIDFLKNGDTKNASNIKSSINLIDFDDDNIDNPPQGNTNSKVSTGDAINDLLSDLGSLSFNNKPSQSSSNNNNLFGDISLLASPSPQSTPQPISNDLFSLNTTPSTTTNKQPLSSDLFSLNTTPTTQPSSNLGLDLLNNTSSPQHSLGFDLLSSNNNNSTGLLLHESSNIKIICNIISKTTNSIQIKLLFTSFQSFLTNVSFSLAVTKQFELNLNPPSSTTLPANKVNGILQDFTIKKKNQNDLNPIDVIKFKWKLSYVLNGSPIEENGVFNSKV